MTLIDRSAIPNFKPPVLSRHRLHAAQSHRKPGPASAVTQLPAGFPESPL